MQERKREICEENNTEQADSAATAVAEYLPFTQSVQTVDAAAAHCPGAQAAQLVAASDFAFAPNVPTAQSCSRHTC